MKLIFEKAAQNGLRKMSPNAARALVARLEAIARDPNERRINIKSLSGASHMFRLRQGNWRAVYRVDRSADEVRVMVIDVRGSVYR